MSDFIDPQKHDDLNAKNYNSIKEFVTILAAAPGSLKTELTGEQLATEIIKGAMVLKTFLENGGKLPDPAKQ
jgi:hypothetical protein